MNILIKTVRVTGFRGLKNIEVELEKTTVLTGMNNAGKTSFLKALQLALGNRQFISQDDFSIHGNEASKEIIIDLLIIPIDDNGNRCDTFSDDWEIHFTYDRIKSDSSGKFFLPLRTIITFDTIKDNFKTEQFILQNWSDFKQEGVNWFKGGNAKKTPFYFDEIPFFYMDAQRDILEDIKLKNSYLGKMLSKIEYSETDIEDIEKQIELLNEKAVNGSDVLINIKENLQELNSAMDSSSSEGVEITPFTKKVRDLNKGLTIYYSDKQESFPMEYHGMGTRSWSSLLTLRAFIKLLSKKMEENQSVFFPVLALEEPEAHLYPNAQKKLYGQLNSIAGQKIISTHSPYIAAAAKLKQIRSFYKDETTSCGQIDIDSLTVEEIRKINRQVINTRGELFFSKFIVFVEGETEEQALPIFANKFFGERPFEMGIDFISVDGFGNYLPFLRFAEALNIPWIIFSDAENTPEQNIKESVRSQFSKCGAVKTEENCLVFLDDGNDFEKQLIVDGFGNEIRKAIASLDHYSNDQHRTAKEPNRLIEINNYDDNTLYETITKSKTQYSPAIAEQIVKSNKDLPPKVGALFAKIAEMIKTEEPEE